MTQPLTILAAKMGGVPSARIPYSLDEIEVTGPGSTPHNMDHSHTATTETRSGLIVGETTRLTILLDALGHARAEAAVPAVTASLRQYEVDIYGPRHAQVGVVDAGYVLHGAIGVGLNRWRLRPEDLPDPETFEAIEGDRVQPVHVDVSDEDIASACLLATELDVEVSAVLSCALATGLAKLSGDIETRGPFRMSTMPTRET